MATGEPYDGEFRLVTASGRERWVEVRGDLVERDGSPRYLRGAIRDISLRKEHEQRLMVLNRVLRHNLRNDLNVIQGRAEMLHDQLVGLEPPEGEGDTWEAASLAERLAEATASSEDLQTQISRFLSRLRLVGDFPLDRAQQSTQTILRKSGQLESLGDKARAFEQLIATTDDKAIEVIQVSPLIERVVDEYRSQYPQATIEVNCPPGIRVQGIVDQLEVAMGELIENAIEHTEDGLPEVRVSVTEREESTVRICVADNGPGLPQTERETLERGEETPLVHGLGLGLWLVKWSMSRMGGSVGVANGSSSGAEVTLTLPAVEIEEVPRLHNVGTDWDTDHFDKND